MRCSSVDARLSRRSTVVPGLPARLCLLPVLLWQDAIVRHVDSFLSIAPALANRRLKLSRSAVIQRTRQRGTRGVLKATSTRSCVKTRPAADGCPP
jgi:hypothetical protein